MKRFTLAFALLFSVHLGFSQANSLVEAPLNDNTAKAARGPNGTADHPFFRGCYLVTQAELFNIPSGTSITSFGYTLGIGAPSTPVAGNFTVYLQNTTDLTYQKGTSFATAISPMTAVFANIMTIPVSATTTSIVLTLSNAFTYNGGGLYVAYDWASTGPFNATPATYLGELSVTPLPGSNGATASSTLATPATLTLTNTRPSFLFGFANAHTNDMQVIQVEAPGKIAAILNTPHQVKAYVRNASTITQNNIAVNLNVTGANLFTNSQVVPSLAAGAGTLVTFTSFNPVNLGANTISVSVGSDQNNLNNSKVYTQSVTCGNWALGPAGNNYTVNSVGFATSSGILATAFTNPVSSSLSGLRGGISTFSGNIGQQLCGVLMDNVGTILATTNTLTISSAMQGTFQDFNFSSMQPLTAGTTYYFGFAAINVNATLYYPAGTYPSYYQSAYFYYYTGIAGGALVQLTSNYGYFGIEAVFGPEKNNTTIVSTPTAVCAGVTCATLSAAGISSYTWSTGSNSPLASICPSATAIYSIVGTNTMGCLSTASISVIANGAPAISISSSTTALCLGSAVSFTAGGANTYSWSTGTQGATSTQTPAANTTYTATGIDINGCVGTNTVNITVYSLTLTVSSNTSICKGKTVTLLASSPDNYSYNWQVGNGTPFPSIAVTPSTTTTYTVEATDVNGCSKSGTVMVTVNPNPTVTLSSNHPTICVGSSATLTAGGASSYLWSNSSTASSITVSPQITTNYVVTGTNTSGCTNSMSVSQVVSLCTGISEQSSNASLSIFPNPNNGMFTINKDNLQDASSVKIYDALGSLVASQELLPGNNAIDLSHASKGIYFVQMIGNNKIMQIAKIIKQ